MKNNQMQSKLTALYERLSNDDSSIGDSTSIVNQKRYLEQYAVKNGFTNIKHYTDDGYTGTNFNRPAFQEMLALINTGDVGVVIVKDMSRFGRNYLEVGYYTEVLLPKKKVRFIAIDSDVDTEGEIDNDFLPIINIMNQWYAEDCGSKIRAIHENMMRNGKRTSGVVPYGYNHDEKDKQHLVIDPVVSPIVKRIFTMTSEGMNAEQIARTFTKEKILCPAAYENQYHPEQASSYVYTDPYKWNGSSIRMILDRQEYLGHTILKRRVLENTRTKKWRKTTEDEQYFFSKTHEPIISEELWEKAQANRLRTKTPKGSLQDNILIGYVYCSDCGLPMSYSVQQKRNYKYFNCTKHRDENNETISHHIHNDVLEDILLSTIKRITSEVIKDEKEFARKLCEKLQNNQERKDYAQQIVVLKGRIKKLDRQLEKLYEDFVEGRISGEDYKSSMDQYVAEQSNCEKKIDEINLSLSMSSDNEIQINRFMDVIQKYKEPTELTEELLDDLINKVIVHERKKRNAPGIDTQEVEIVLNFIGRFKFEYSEEELQAEEERKTAIKVENRLAQREKNNQARREAHKKRREEIFKANDGHYYPKRICQYCGKEFWPNVGNRKYCSVECYNGSRYARNKTEGQEKAGVKDEK